MTSYISGRLGQALLIALIISLVTFLLLFVAKDPARALASPEATAEEIAALRRGLGLDQPLYVQYGRWLAGVVRGDFGMSLYSRQPVTALLPARIRASAQLAGSAIFLVTVIGIPLGILAAVYRGTIIDTVVTALAGPGKPCPSFGWDSCW